MINRMIRISIVISCLSGVSPHPQPLSQAWERGAREKQGSSVETYHDASESQREITFKGGAVTSISGRTSVMDKGARQ
jgi:hypothetical protein